MNDTEIKTIKRDVEVQLSSSEIAELRTKACAALDTVDDLTARSKTLKTEAKEARALAKKGTITRMEECREEQDFRTGEFRVVRVDNGEIVERRALTVDERQTMLDVGAPVAASTGRKKRLGSTKPDEPVGDGEGTH